MLIQCWTSVTDVGQTLKQHWVNVSFKQYLVISLVDDINAVTLYSRLLYAYSHVLYIYATLGLHVTVPRMPVLWLCESLILTGINFKPPPEQG